MFHVTRQCEKCQWVSNIAVADERRCIQCGEKDHLCKLHDADGYEITLPDVEVAARNATLPDAPPTHVDVSFNEYFDKNIERLIVGQPLSAGTIPDAETDKLLGQMVRQDQRRVKVVRVGYHDVINWVFSRTSRLPSHMMVLTHPVKLPPDFRVVGVREEFMLRCFDFQIEHRSFEPVPDGMPAPPLYGLGQFEWQPVPTGAERKYVFPAFPYEMSRDATVAAVVELWKGGSLSIIDALHKMCLELWQQKQERFLK